MRVHAFTKFHQKMRSVSRPGVTLLGEVYKPAKAVTAFEEEVRLLRCPRGSEASPGDHVIYELDHFVLGAHTTEADQVTFRLIPLPDVVAWSIKPVKVKDAVTGLLKDTNETLYDSHIWVRQITKGFNKDIQLSEKQVILYICGSTPRVGDLIDRRVIKRVYEEQGIVFAET